MRNPFKRRTEPDVVAVPESAADQLQRARASAEEALAEAVPALKKVLKQIVTDEQIAAIASYGGFLQEVGTNEEITSLDEERMDYYAQAMAAAGVYREAAQLMVLRAVATDWRDPGERERWFEDTTTRRGVLSLFSTAAVYQKYGIFEMETLEEALQMINVVNSLIA